MVFEVPVAFNLLLYGEGVRTAVTLTISCLLLSGLKDGQSNRPDPKRIQGIRL